MSTVVELLSKHDPQISELPQFRWRLPIARHISRTPEMKLHRKLCSSLEEAIKRSGLQDGMTISFHHGFREGDKVINDGCRYFGQDGLQEPYARLELAAELP